MRVTDLTKQNAVLRNVANNSARVQELQETMASGKRINKLSDDPIGATQIQDYRTKLSFIDRVKQNIRNNFTWLDRTDAELDHVGQLLARTKSLMLAQSNDSSDSATRRVTAEEIKDIIDNLVNAGNAKAAKVYLFAGSKTFSQPLLANGSLQDAGIDVNDLPIDQRFLLDPEQFAATMDGWSQNPYVVKITKEGAMGRAHYVVSDDGGKTWSRANTLLPQIELFNDQGRPSEKVMMRFSGQVLDQLGDPVVFPQGLEFHFAPNPPIAYQGNDDKRMVTTGEGVLLPLNITAQELFFADPNKESSVDIFDMMFSLKRALEDNDSTVLEKRLNDVDRAFDQVLQKRADIGSVRKEMEDQMNKIQDREFNSTKQMSDLEDLDFPSAVVQMNLADVRNKATLDTSGRLIQPSLLNFLK
jgi:flagellar hook-associated protein 3 FlgL